jgi:protein tyrosine/serine phosphatase
MKLIQVDKNLYRGDRPVTDTDWRTLQKLGIQRVINLEGGIMQLITHEANGEARSAWTYGMESWHVGMNSIFPPRSADVATVLAIVAPYESMKPTLIHCKEGRDRTGFVIAAYRMQHQKWDFGAAVEEMKRNGFHRWYLFWIPKLLEWRK